jgi:hypothetical protein
MSDDKKTKEMVREMAQLSIFSGRINELQEKNLKSYPFVFFNGVKKATIEYDLTYNKDDPFNDVPAMHNPVVAYHLEIEEDAENPVIDKRYKVLEASVRNLLWKEIVVEIHINDKIAYRSKKNG